MAKYILKWCSITFASLLAVLVLTIFSLCLISPITMANLSSDLGLKKLENTFYIADYKKNNNINSLYKVVILSYNLKEYCFVEEYYEELESLERYDEFISYINAKNFNAAGSNLNKSALLNEDNYLKNRYVSALINNSKVEKAFDYALKNFKDFESLDYKNIGNYLFYNLVAINNDDVNAKFLETCGFEDSLFNVLVKYADTCIDAFNDGYRDLAIGDGVYLIALNARIRQVYSNIYTLSERLSLEYPSDLEQKVIDVNKIAMRLL